MKLRILILILALIGGRSNAQVIISEFMAVNSNGIEDEDGDRSDWIELYNAGSTAVNLGGWHLTDKADDLTKWEISPVVLQPGAYRIIWASNKNRKDPDEELHTNFKLSGSGEFLALVKPDGTTITSAFSPTYPAQVDDISFGHPMGPSSASNITVIASSAMARALVPSDASLDYDNNTGLTPWTLPGFNDAAWASGNTGIGYERSSGYESLINFDVESLLRGINFTIYTRIPFSVPAGMAVNSAELRMRYDDGFTAYVNGEVVAGANMAGNAWDSKASGGHESTGYESFSISNGNAFDLGGGNVLAIHGANDSLNSRDFLILPELILSVSSAGAISTNSLKYFSTPSPGNSNEGGTDNIGPQFSQEKHLPLQPLDHEDLSVSVKVIDEADGIASLTMTYEVMFGGETTVTMYDDGLHGDGAAGDSVFGASIPASAYAAGEMIRYRFNAIDGAGHASRWPLYYDPLNSPEFFGTMAQVAVTSSMPVMHWFVEDEANADSISESRSSLIYNGTLYDNIMTRVRGKSSTLLPIKKSHKFDFNRGHHFEYDPSARKVEEMNLNTTMLDKTYLRRMLAWQTYEDVGAPGSKSFLVHLRRNNAFFGVQNFVEQVDQDFLIRHGYDPNGAMYKIRGTTNSVPKTHVIKKETRKEDPDQSDIETFVLNIQGGDRESYIFDNMDVAEVINYLTLTTLLNDGDSGRKNHYYYRDTDGSGDWSVFPWDKDLTFGKTWDWQPNNMGYGMYHDIIVSYSRPDLYHPKSGLLHDAVWNSPDLKALYLRRLRSVADQILQPTSTPQEQRYYENLIADYLALHTDDLMLDYNEWGNPWDYSPTGLSQYDYKPGEANTNFTINTYLNPSRATIYGNSDMLSAQPASPTIQISAVDVIPASGNQAEEYIELYNPNSYAVDISGWSISNAVSHVFRGGSVILPNDYFYVSPDTRAFRNRTTSPKGGEKRFVQGSYKGMLSSRGETLELYDSAGTLKDTEIWAENLSDAQRYLRITEVMYHPALPNGSELTEDRLEFVELKNIGTAPLNIDGTFFTEGLIYTNPAVTLPAGGYLVIASDPVEFANQYDTAGMTVVGPFSGYLANGNDGIELEDHRGETIQRFEYNDDWYEITDGIGFSLTLIDPANTNIASWNDKASWRPSLDLGGSPGTSDSNLAPESVMINEVLAHSDTGDDWVEIKNMTGTAMDLSHWFLSDDPGDLKKYKLPVATMLPANGFTVLTESAFNSGANAFALSELGDEVILTKALADGTLQGYQTDRDFDASGKDISFGRWIDSEGDSQFIPLATQTPGAENSAPKTGPVLISEIMYAPEAGKAEYIELYNSSTSTVSLYDTDYPTNKWSLADAIDFTFTTGTTLDPGEHLIVCSTNPTAFRAQYSVPAEVEVFGPFSGVLNNAGERLRLYYPGNPEPTFVPQIQIESVNYKPAAPWPVVVNTPGISIERVAQTSPANDPTSWQASIVNGTPGTTLFSVADPEASFLSAWRELHFGNPPGANSGDADDYDLDGRNNYDEFVAGTNPTDDGDFPVVEIAVLLNGNVKVSILAKATDPAISYGLERYYTLEQKTNLTDSIWNPVPGASDVLAIDQILSIEQAPGNNSIFTRAQFELQ